MNQWQFEKIMKLVLFFNGSFSACATLSITTKLNFFNFFWKFISKVRYDDVKDIKRNMIPQLYTISK